jgi:hypothetical protein
VGCSLPAAGPPRECNQGNLAGRDSRDRNSMRSPGHPCFSNGGAPVVKRMPWHLHCVADAKHHRRSLPVMATLLLRMVCSRGYQACAGHAFVFHRPDRQRLHFRCGAGWHCKSAVGGRPVVLTVSKRPVDGCRFFAAGVSLPPRFTTTTQLPPTPHTREHCCCD